METDSKSWYKNVFLSNKSAFACSTVLYYLFIYLFTQHLYIIGVFQILVTLRATVPSFYLTHLSFQNKKNNLQCQAPKFR